MAFAGAASAAPSSAGPAGSATTPNPVVLPAPTGPHPVGWQALHLVDKKRTDPWVPTGPRELMVSMLYPATVARGDRAPYASEAESRLMLGLFPASGAPGDTMARVRTNARVGAPALPGRSPLVVLSPGKGFPRWTLTTVGEDLASHGYVVALVDHTYEAAAVTFPGGHVAECQVCRGEVRDAAIAASRALDLSFVLDSLLADKHYGRMIDRHEILVGGHSLGGAAAANTMVADPRVDAGFNMDGTFLPPITQDLARPFLMVSGEDRVPGNITIPDWDQTWAHLTSTKHWLHMPGIGHAFFSDVGVILDQLNLPPRPPSGGLTPVSGKRAVQLMRTYLGAWADLTLRHRHEPLLDGPSPRFPDVEIVDPTH